MNAKIEGNTYLMTYAFGPDHKLDGPLGPGRFVAVMQCWYKGNEIMYCFAADEFAEVPGYSGVWVKQAEVLMENSPWKVQDPEVWGELVETLGTGDEASGD